MQRQDIQAALRYRQPKRGMGIALGKRQRCSRPLFRMEGQASNAFAIDFNMHPPVTSRGHAQYGIALNGEILVPDLRSLRRISYIPFRIGVGNGGNILANLVGDVRHFPVGQITADRCRIFAHAGQIAAVQTAGSHLDLCNGAVRQDIQRFGAHLAGIVAAVGQPMVKNIPFSADLLYAAVGCAGGVAAFPLAPPVITDIAIAHQRPAIAELPVGVG